MPLRLFWHPPARHNRHCLPPLRARNVVLRFLFKVPPAFLAFGGAAAPLSLSVLDS